MPLNVEAIDKAIIAHAQWKNRLRTAIDTGKSEFSPVTVATDNQCDFGKWLYSLDVVTQQSENWKKVKVLHADFHKCASGCLTHALGGHKELAEKSMSIGGDFAKATTSLTTAMMTWKNSIK